MDPIFSRFTTDAMALVCMEERRFVACNEASLRLFGVPTEEEFLRLNPWELSPELQPDGERSDSKGLRYLMLALESGSHYFDWVHATRDGRLIDCLVLISRIERDGRVYLQSTCRDISAERRALRDLQRKQHELSQIMAAISESALVSWTDHEGRIVDVNDHFCARSGFTREELIGRTHDVVIPPDRPPEIRAQVVDVLRGGKLWTGVLSYQAKNGDPYYLRTVITPIRDENGAIMKYLGIQTDLTREVETEQKLQFAQEVAQMGSFEYHAEQDSFTGSANLCRMYQVDPALRGPRMTAAIAERVHPEDLPLVMACWGESQRTGKDYFILHRLRFPDGGIKYVECRGNVIRDRTGTRLLGTATDVTETVLREERMKQLLDFNDAVMHSVDVMLMTVDENGTFTGMNDEAGRRLGYEPGELIGHQRADILHLPLEIVQVTAELNREYGLRLEPGLEALLYKARKGINESRRWSWVRRDGSSFQVELSVTPLRNPQGKLYGYIGVARDLTHEIEIHEALEQEKAKSLHNAKLASLGEMAAGVAHEINNPLAMIVGSAELLENLHGGDEAKFRKRLETIHKATGRITKIVKGLQKFARATGTGEFQPADLNVIIQEALVLVETKARRHSVELRFQPGAPCPVLCDAVEIEQVIVNLLNNGIDAVKPLPERWLALELRPAPAAVRLRVTDAGPGIPREIESKLFQPFFTTKPVGEGTGLGLSIVKGILDQHRASIRVDRAARNTCFELEFPHAAGAGAAHDA